MTPVHEPKGPAPTDRDKLKALLGEWGVPYSEEDGTFRLPGGENEYVFTEGEHRGHRTHIHPGHGLAVICSCGAFTGIFSGVAEFGPEPCPVCAARGIPLGGGGTGG
jgi:hypothetical protein